MNKEINKIHLFIKIHLKCTFVCLIFKMYIKKMYNILFLIDLQRPFLSDLDY